MNLWDKIADWGWQAFAAAVGWIFYMERKISSISRDVDGLKLHVSENYVKKSDLTSLKEDIASEFREVKASQGQILDVLLSQKIGTNRS